MSCQSAFVPSFYSSGLSSFIKPHTQIERVQLQPRQSFRKVCQNPFTTMTATSPASSSAPMYADDTPDVLVKILKRKVTEIEALKEEMKAQGESHPVSQRLAKYGQWERSKDFYNALNRKKGSVAVIAEIKRKSPSTPNIGQIKNPAALSRLYQESGARAISVLTDFEGFGGTLDDLKAVVRQQKKYVGEIPGPAAVLRKDFTLDKVQIAEAAVAGASAVLLIVAALKERTKELLQDTHALGLDALVEVHNEEELKIAIDAGAEIIGINNRDLRTFNVSLETSKRLKAMIPEGILTVSESGIKDCLNVWELRDSGFNAVLVGETLVRAAEASTSISAYQSSSNGARSLIKAFISKGSSKYGSAGLGSNMGVGEGAKESLGELMM